MLIIQRQSQRNNTLIAHHRLPPPPHIIPHTQPQPLRPFKHPSFRVKLIRQIPRRLITLLLSTQQRQQLAQIHPPKRTQPLTRKTPLIVIAARRRHLPQIRRHHRKLTRRT